MIIQDENGTSYWGGFEVKSTIRGLIVMNLGLLYLAMVGYEWGIAPIWVAIFFVFVGLLISVSQYNGRARLHAQGSWKLPFKSDPRS